MSEEEHFRKLERMYHGAPCNAYYKPLLSIAKGQTELRIPISENLHHAAGAVHGSAYFKAVDDAAHFATQSLVQDAFVVTTHLSVQLTRPIVAGCICARGRVTFSSRNLFHAETILTDEHDNEIGRGTASFVRSKVPLSEDIGYA